MEMGCRMYEEDEDEANEWELKSQWIAVDPQRKRISKARNQGGSLKKQERARSADLKNDLEILEPVDMDLDHIPLTTQGVGIERTSRYNRTTNFNKW